MDHLIRFLQRKLSPEDLALLEAELQQPQEVDYEAVFRRVASTVKKQAGLFRIARASLEVRYKDLADLPEGRRLTILRSSSPVLLLVLFRYLIEKSYGERFGDLDRSLQLARVAVEVAQVIAASEYLTPADNEDLLAESQAYLGNALRLNSDLGGAESSLKKAESHIQSGTGDRVLKADFLNLLATLRVFQARCTEAAEVVDAEIRLRKLLRDDQQYGFALVQRGWIGCMIGDPIPLLCDILRAGLSRVEDPYLFLQGTHTLADVLARKGYGLDALDALGTAKIPLDLVESERLSLHHRWTRGICYRALGGLDQAERDLRAVQEEIAASDAAFVSAIVSLDLACVYAAKGKLKEVKQLAEDAYAIFKAEGLEERALAAVVVLREAIEAERVTESMAVAVVNFVIRAQHNKALRFEWRDE